MARMVETMDSRRQNTHARTLIGADTRIAGKISFAGTFQTEGHVEGNIWCQTEGQGTILIGKTGQVIGSMRSEHVVVAGQVRGNIQAFNTLEIRDSARVLGDLAYRELLMQPGGVVDGVLKHSASDERAHLTSAPAATTPVARSVSRSRSRRGTSIAAAALCALAATIYLLWPAPTQQGASEASSQSVAPVAPPTSTPAAEPAALAELPATPVSAAPPLPEPTVAAASSRGYGPVDAIVVIRGESAGKPADIVFVVANAAGALVKKKRDDHGDGSRIELGQGAKKRITIAADELIRVAQGQDLEIYYQGRKVSATEGSAWLSFVPFANRAGSAN